MPKPTTTLRLLLRSRALLGRTKSTWRESAFDEERDGAADHEAKGLHRLWALSPLIWLAVVWASLLLALIAVGYLLPELQDEDETRKLLARLSAPLLSATPDYPARRAALAFSGVTLAITAALSLTGLFWAAMAARVCAPAYRQQVLGWVLCFLVATFVGSFVAVRGLAPFASQFGDVLLQPRASGLDAAPWAAQVPRLMFVLSFVVPSILLAGASFLLQPMVRPASPKQLDLQLRRLAMRLRELDQMLYIGALALVFGTLQLSAAMSVPLASLPRAADLKTRIDLCKSMAPAPTASSPFFADAPRAMSSDPDFVEQCRALPAAFARLDAAESLKRLVQGVTLATGLAFSALLAAIYVPALIVLRQMVERRQRMARSAGSKPEVAALDPFARLGAAVATFGPLFAGLLANTLAGS